MSRLRRRQRSTCYTGEGFSPWRDVETCQLALRRLPVTEATVVVDRDACLRPAAALLLAGVVEFLMQQVSREQSAHAAASNTTNVEANLRKSLVVAHRVVRADGVASVGSLSQLLFAECRFARTKGQKARWRNLGTCLATTRDVQRR